jgi:hypothetical protein
MRALAVIFLFAIAALPAPAQRGSNLLESPVPKGPCRYTRLSGIRQVKESPSIEELTRFDISVLTAHWVFFPVGTEVSVNRREGPWSCVSGGWPFRTGWMETWLLGPLVEKDR